MLEIHINAHRVDLPTDIRLSITIENPFMLQDRIPAPYSLAFTLPPTAHNLRVFNFPDRIPSYSASGAMTATRECRILFEAVTIATGVISLAEYNQGIKATFRGADINDVMRSRLYETPMHQYVFDTANWQVINFDDPTNYAGRYRQHAIDAANGSDPRMVVAPIKTATGDELLSFTAEREATRADGDPIPYPRAPQAMADQEYINYYNPATLEFALRAVSPPPRGWPYAIVHTAIFPFLRVHGVLDEIFGAALRTNAFSGGELADLVIPSTYFHNWRKYNGRDVAFHGPGGMMFSNKPPFSYNIIYPPGTPAQPFYRTNQFLPSVPAPDLLKELLKVFCASMVIKGGALDIRLNKDIITAPVAHNWDGKLIDRPIITPEALKVYKYGYEGEEEYTPGDDLITVDSVHDMINDPFEPEEEDELTRVYFIASTGQYYERNAIEDLDGDGEPLGTFRYSYRLLSGGYGQAFETDKDTYDAVASLKPMPLVPAEYWWTAENTLAVHPGTDWWTVPHYDGDRETRSESAHLMFFRGFVPSVHPGHTYPLLSPYDHAPDGTPIGDISLAWQGENGLLANFHAPFRQWVERDKVKVNGAFLLSPQDIHNLDITEKVHLHGRNFYIERIQLTIRHNRIDPAVIDLIET